MNYKLIDLFKFFPSELIIANELVRGDIGFIHSRWGMILTVNERKDFDNHGSNLEITFIDNGISYLSPKRDIKIIKRDLLDSVGIQKYIEDYLEESRRRLEEEILAEQNEQDYLISEKDSW